MLYVKQSNTCSPLTHYVYITSSTKVSDWYVRKWSDNTLEAWFTGTVSFDKERRPTEISTIFLTVSRISLPFAVTEGSIICSIDWSYIEWVQSRFISNTMIEIRRFGNGNSSNVVKSKASCYIIGKAD